MTTDHSDPPLHASPFDDTELPPEDAGDDDYNKARIRAALFDDEPLPPERLDRFIVLGTLGKGGMGTVLEAYDPALERKIALKVLHTSIGQRHAERLVREAKALAKLSHPNVVQVYEVGDVQGRTFIAMEMVRGETLRQWHARDPRPGWRECVEVYLQAGRGLAAAHAAGMVHRDFKPDNCIIDAEGRVRVLDFGLVRELDVSSIDQESSTADLRERAGEGVLETPLTRTGAVLGTVAYMPLEQLDGTPVDALGDQFSFCVSLYEAVYGERPFAGDTVGTLTQALVEGEVEAPPRGSKVPAKLRRVLVRGLAQNPNERWPSMDVLLAELRRQVTPHSGRWFALAIGLGLAAVGVGSWLQPAPVAVQQGCDGAEDRLVGVWDDARRQEVEAAILGTGKSFAAGTWERVESRLDEYAEGWMNKHTAVCEAASEVAGPSEEDTGLRYRCLGERRTALRDTVELLANVDDELLVNAVDLVTKLPTLDRCDDLDALRAAIPPPEDPEVAAEVALLRERLSKADTLEAAGKYPQQETEVDAVVLQAKDIGYPPLLAEALVARGRARERNAMYEDARQDLERAYSLAVEHEHDRVATEAATALVWVVGYKQQEYERALQWGQTALALASRPMAEKWAKPNALRFIAGMLLAQGRDDEALEHFQRALALQKESSGDQHPDVAGLLHDMGLFLADYGKLEESLEAYRQSIAIFESTTGGPHPDIILPLNDINYPLRLLEKYDEALDYLWRAVPVAERSLGSEHPTMGILWENVGWTMVLQGKPDEGHEHLERGLRILERTLGSRHPDLEEVLLRTGVTLEKQGRREEALEYHKRALAILEAAYGPEHRRLLDSLDYVGDSLFRLGRLDESLEYARRSVKIREASFGPKHPEFADGLRMLGDNLMMQGKLDEALESYRRALVITQMAPDPRDDQLAATLWGLGMTLLRQGQLGESLETLRRSATVAESSFGPESGQLADVIMGMAEVELKQRKLVDAREHAKRAVAIFEAKGQEPVELAWARFLLAQALWPQREERPRARELAEMARDGLTDNGAPLDAERTTTVQTWLARHPVP